MNLNMNLNLMHRKSLMQQNESEFKSNCRQRSISINNSHLNYINLYPKSNLNLNSNTKLNRTSGPNSPAAEVQPVAKTAAEASATATAAAEAFK